MPKHSRSSDRSEKKIKTGKNEGFAITHNKTSPVPATTKSPVKTATLKDKGKQKEPAPVQLPTTFKVVAGSYEKLLYGLEGSVTVAADSKLEYHLKPIFIFPAHVSCIKAVAASPNGGKWLASGSADEIIKVWDLRRRKEIGGLMQHEGSITHLSFPSRSHLMSASEDGTLCLFRARDWAVLRSLKGHKGRINSFAVHPSGKVALSVGKDRTLRMWDLMRGKGCASTKLGKEGEIVRWSIDGSTFVVQSGSVIDVYSTDMNLIHTIRHPARLHDVKFCKRVDKEGELLLVGAEDKKVSVYEISDNLDKPPEMIAFFTGHSNRVKAIQTLEIALPQASGRSSTVIVCTVSSDGNIHIYDMFALDERSENKLQDISPVVVYDSKGTRLTCVTLGDGDVQVHSTIQGKRKRVNDQEDDEMAVTSDDDDQSGSDWENEEEGGDTEYDSE